MPRDAVLKHNPYDLIIIKENFIPEDNLDEIMMLTTKPSTGHATTINNENLEKGLDHHDTNLEVRNTLWYDIPEEMAKKLEQSISYSYLTHIQPKYNCQVKGYDPCQLLGYNPGGHYMSHIDCESYNEKQQKWVQTMPRDISLLFYLNEEFGGGELEFPELGLTIKPRRGMMIAFPSYKEFLHKVNPVTWGHRYTLVSWLQTEQKLYDTIPQKWIPAD